MFFLYLVALCTCLMAASMLSAGLQALMLVHVLTYDLKNYLNKINKNGKSKKNNLKRMEQLRDFVQSHALMIQLSDEFSNLFLL